MTGNNTQNVKDIIKKLMRNPKLADKLDGLDALDIWKELIGQQIQKYITDARMYKGILYVKLSIINYTFIKMVEHYKMIAKWLNFIRHKLYYIMSV